MTSKRTLGFV